MLEIIAFLSFPVLYVVFALWEHLRPARPLPKVRGWRARGPLFLMLAMGLSIATAIAWGDWVAAHALIDLSWTGAIGGAVIALLALQLGGYAWHRTVHHVGPLFRWFHQIHHSAERLDVAGAVYFHPFDVIAFSFATSFVPFVVLGVSAEAGLIANIVVAFLSLFQHANVKTPRWVGYLAQRPESHSLHHARGVHAYNYADLPIIDMIFGTFRNPESFEPEQGYWDGASAHYGAMLIGRDLTEPPREEQPATALATRG